MQMNAVSLEGCAQCRAGNLLLGQVRHARSPLLRTNRQHHVKARNGQKAMCSIKSEGVVGAAVRASAAALAALQISVALLSLPVVLPPPAEAVLVAPKARVPRTVEAALRRSIPAFNADVRGIQTKLENIAYKLRIPQRKPWGAMADDVAAATAVVNQHDKVSYGVKPDHREEGELLVAGIQKGLAGVQGAIDARDADRTSQRVEKVLAQVAELELLQAPGLPFSIPKDYAGLPRLVGRAVVEMVIEKPDGDYGYIGNDGGGPQQQANLQIVLDGYSAPITAGNFAANVLDGLYNGRSLNVSDSSIMSAGSASGRVIPLEILPAGQFDPLYRSPLDIQAGELPVLPMSIYGAVAMAHPADQGDVFLDGTASADEFFVYKFERRTAGLAGLSFDEGAFGVFGYVTKGGEFLYQLQGGDVIKKAVLTSGADKLIRS